MDTTYLTDADRTDLRAARINLVTLSDRADQNTMKSLAAGAVKKIDSILTSGKISASEKRELTSAIGQMRSLVDKQSREDNLRDASMHRTAADKATHASFVTAFHNQIPYCDIGKYQAQHEVKK